MRNRLKRMLALLLACVFSLILGGCASSSGNDGEAGSEENQVVVMEETEDNGEDNADSDKEEAKDQSTDEALSSEDGQTGKSPSQSDEGVVYDRAPDPDAAVGKTGDKTITVKITGKDGEVKTETIHTKAGDLLSALKESDIAAEAEDTPGYIVTVGGYTADVDNYEWWLISKDGQALTNSVDQTPIHDGEVYDFVLQGAPSDSE